METVYLEKRECYHYPSSAFCYSPSVSYPEYPFTKGTLAEVYNEVYDMVRAALRGLALDEANYGSENWNPLKGLLPRGGTVLLKPNWVRHFNPCGSLDCMVTHPSIIRCMIDFCVIAGAKKIILGDAPIQGADIRKFLKENRYWQLKEFYHSCGIEITLIDFRDLVVQIKNYVITPSEAPRVGHHEACEIDMAGESYHAKAGKNAPYAICGYPLDKINVFHSTAKGRHSYSLSKTALESDLIINLPKPKTHRFAGITGAQKNFVGICPDKESLPHYIAGSTKQGGDESNRSGFHATQLSWWYNKYLIWCKKGYKPLAFCAHIVQSLLERTKFPGEYSKGAWHGNDTIWRTILDLSLLIRYTDTEARFSLSNPERKILTIGDMIISGERNGPLEPRDKPLGIILATTNCTAFDTVFCQIAGFPDELIPTVREGCKNSKLLAGGRESIVVCSNLPEIDGKRLSKCVFPKEWYFAPSPYWIDILTRQEV